eukprot:TRINITY_DN9620_c0_g1_i1.p1 TRINITY_DN9620_c0_g1~~TRINITY_DN9620_c0_g1_i1.p1  ORF type:complete len:697 (-),score=166.88 TRINITY_DN9620_c0_g1_i1:354-2444(-)
MRIVWKHQIFVLLSALLPADANTPAAEAESEDSPNNVLASYFVLGGLVVGLVALVASVGMCCRRIKKRAYEFLEGEDSPPVQIVVGDGRDDMNELLGRARQSVSGVLGRVTTSRQALESTRTRLTDSSQRAVARVQESATNSAFAGMLHDAVVSASDKMIMLGAMVKVVAHDYDPRRNSAGAEERNERTMLDPEELSAFLGEEPSVPSAAARPPTRSTTPTPGPPPSRRPVLTPTPANGAWVNGLPTPPPPRRPPPREVVLCQPPPASAEGRRPPPRPETLMQSTSSATPQTPPLSRSKSSEKKPKPRPPSVENIDWSDLIPVTNISIHERLGSGNFGVVYRGRWNKMTDVALKALRDHASMQEFVREARVLVALKHPHVMQYFGVFISDSDGLYIVMEHMCKGSLRQMLVDADEPYSVVQLLDMMRQAAAGMQYLESCSIVHRDLALRNLLVTIHGDAGKHLIKIADFGLSRTSVGEYYKSEDRVVPIKWTSPEALRFGRYSSRSDVWSFGITMWETFSHGEFPYANMTNSEATEKVWAGYRLRRPDECLDTIYAIMTMCWRDEPRERPSFQVLVEMLGSTLDELDGASSDTDSVAAKHEYWLSPSTPGDSGSSDDPPPYIFSLQRTPAPTPVYVDDQEEYGRPTPRSPALVPADPDGPYGYETSLSHSGPSLVVGDDGLYGYETTLSPNPVDGQ